MFGGSNPAVTRAWLGSLARRCLRLAFFGNKTRVFCRHVNCRLIIVSSCRRLQTTAIKTPFEAVIKNDIKFNLQLWHVFGLTVIGNVMPAFSSNVKIMFFLQSKLCANNYNTLPLNIGHLKRVLDKVWMILVNVFYFRNIYTPSGNIVMGIYAYA